MTRSPKLLVVDDGDRHIELAHAFLRQYDFATRCTLPGPCWTCPERPGCTLTHAHDAREMDEALTRHPDVDVVLLDVAFDLPVERLVPSDEPDLERRRRLQGIDLLGSLRRSRGDLPVILMTSQEELAYEDAAEKLAVDELLTFAGEATFDARALGLLVERVLARRETPAASETEAGGWAWGRSAPMGRLRRDAITLARTSLPMLLLGETGTGKSALAEQVIHPATGRGGPFVAVDLASIPPTLAAAELFGTARGAFSGAVARAGRFEAASGGTLLLDEIGNLPLEVQRMLLLALQDGRVTRLGETEARPVDVKLVAATNADLAAAVASGAFRADLHARLNPAARLVLPPLRDRMDDLPELAATFVQRAFSVGADRALVAAYLAAAKLPGAPTASLAFGKAPAEPPPGVAFVLPRAALAAMKAHPWPGNVRELEMVVRSAAVFALADAVHAAEEGRDARGTGSPREAVTTRGTGSPREAFTARGAEARTIPIPVRLVRELLAAGRGEGKGASGGPGGRGAYVFDVKPGASLHAVARALEEQLYRRLFVETGGDFAAMAGRLLGDASPPAERRVRLRFNQLGLKVKSTIRRS